MGARHPSSRKTRYLIYWFRVLGVGHLGPEDILGLTRWQSPCGYQEGGSGEAPQHGWGLLRIQQFLSRPTMCQAPC